jgi:predicted nucleic acid-binding protein
VIVVDSNVIAYAFIEGIQTPLARRARELDPNWRIPTLWRHEFLNILASYGRFHGVAPAELRSLWNKAVAIMSPSELPVDMPSALELAVHKGITAYDAQFLVLSQVLGVPLVTADKALAKAFPRQAILLKDFAQ